MRLSVKPIYQDEAILWQIVPPHVLQAWSELQHQILIIIIYLQNLVIVREFFITHVFNFQE